MKNLNAVLRVFVSTSLIIVLSGCAVGDYVKAVKSGHFVPSYSSEKPSPPPELQQSSVPTKSEVMNAQRKLLELGYKIGSPDGALGPKTIAGIETFQKERGFKIDGLVSSFLIQVPAEEPKTTRE